MKTFGIIAKIAVALVAVAGLVYIAATYGDKIVAWCKELLVRFGCVKDDRVIEFFDEETPTAENAVSEADFEG